MCYWVGTLLLKLYNTYNFQLMVSQSVTHVLFRFFPIKCKGQTQSEIIINWHENHRTLYRTCFRLLTHCLGGLYDYIPQTYNNNNRTN